MEFLPGRVLIAELRSIVAHKVFNSDIIMGG